MHALIDNLAMLALSYQSANEATMNGLNSSWWRFRLFNASKESRERLWRLYTNPSIVAPYTQFLYGQDTWTTEMFSTLPQLAHCNVQNIPETLTHYLMVVLTPYSNFLYGGSATGTLPRLTSASSALRARISEHEE